MFLAQCIDVTTDGTPQPYTLIPACLLTLLRRGGSETLSLSTSSQRFK